MVVDQRERHLVVGVGRKREVGKLLANLLVVVDLAVADQEQAPVLGDQRLLAATDVDDRQAPMPEPVPTDRHDAAVVGTAVSQPLEHLLKGGGV